MSQETVKTEIDQIMSDTALSAEEQISRLETMRADVRAEMRAATEGPIVSDDNVGAELKALDQALDRLGYSADSPEDGGGATL